MASGSKNPWTSTKNPTSNKSFGSHPFSPVGSKGSRTVFKPTTDKQFFSSKTTAAKAADVEAGMLSLVMEPLTLSAFLTLIEASKVYPFEFPDRSVYIADIINNSSSATSSGEVSAHTVQSVLQKIKAHDNNPSNAHNKIQDRFPVSAVAKTSSFFHVAVPKISVCRVCEESTELAWKTRIARSSFQPFFIPYEGRPAQGRVYQKVCSSCGTVYHLNFHCPEGDDGPAIPYSKEDDHADWFQLTKETVISRKLLEAHDHNL